MVHPLNSLLRPNIHSKFNGKYWIVFNTIKQAIASENVLVYFDKEKKTYFITDAINTGLGVVLSHRFNDGSERRIAFASRIHHKSEMNCSAIDKEALAIIFGVKKYI